jgi:hypothetical protein
MAGLEPATQWAHVRAPGDFLLCYEKPFRGADAPRLGGQVKPGHGELGY